MYLYKLQPAIVDVAVDPSVVVNSDDDRINAQELEQMKQIGRGDYGNAQFWESSATYPHTYKQAQSGFRRL
ncbi:unnamed protein product [Parnassius apollo]|uniref:(apollo) hypothetical protein n=1 Tax=Parnassius apollo TaxID=110799 RepID=A0A8S3XKE5_PARAO|nr:unnamed protein product [Parnassius apollo]